MVGTASTTYGDLLRTPGAAAFSAAALVGRMPISMLGIGTVLLVEDRRGSYALAGAVSAAYALGLAAFSPLVSRAVDRYGQARVLPLALAAHATGLVALLLLTEAGAPAVLLLLAAVLTGGALPPLGSCVRARWGALLTARGRDAEAPAAFALESVADEVVFVAGPLLVVTLATALDPVAGLLAALGLGALGTLALAAQRATQPAAHTGDGPRRPSALRLGGVRTLAASMVFVGVVFGSAEVVMVAFGDERGSETGSGLLLALVAVGSAVAGLAYGARTWRTPLPRRFVLALAGLAVGVVPLLLAPGLLTMAPAALLAGIAISPTLIASFALVDGLVAADARTEGFTWLNSGLGVGVAAGSALGGAVADEAGARPGFLVCVVGALLALAVAAAWRRTLAPAAVLPAH